MWVCENFIGWKNLTTYLSELVISFRKLHRQFLRFIPPNVWCDSCGRMGEEKTPKQQILMTTLESLGNHLHSQITTRFPQLTYSLVSKITGILLECGEKEVLAMLQNGLKLQMRISQVLRTLYTDQPPHNQITSPQLVFYY